MRVALDLEKKFHSDKDIQITLVDQRDYHLFNPNLFEVAASAEELTSLTQLKKSIALPLKDILQGKNIKLVIGELKQTDPQKKQILVGQKQIEFDYLILSLGSKSDFLNIPGAEKFGLVLKHLPDAFRIRNQVEFAIQSHKLDVNKKNLKIVVAGGGYTGLELAGELKGLVDFLAWENQYPREKIEIEVIEASPKLVSGFDSRLSQDAYDRLRDLAIHVRLSSRITEVEQNFISLMSGEKIAYDVLIWTVGIKPCPINCPVAMPLDHKGRLCTNEYLQLPGHQNIFALGDIACVVGINGQPVPASAQDAIDQGRYVAKVLPLVMRNKLPEEKYSAKSHGFIVNLGGKWAVVANKKFYTAGYLGYIVDQLAHIRYFASLIGIFKAIKYVWFEAELYSRND